MQAARGISVLALVCAGSLIVTSCDSSSPSKHTSAQESQSASKGVTERLTPPKAPKELEEEGVTVTEFSPQQSSALYVTMTVEKMDPNGDGYDITPGVAAAPLAGKEFRIPSDTKARWGLIDIKQDPSGSMIFTHRVGPSGTTYSIRQYNCVSQRVRYVSTGETIAEMRTSKADAQMSDIQPRSIAYYLGRLACTDFGS